MRKLLEKTVELELVDWLRVLVIISRIDDDDRTCSGIKLQLEWDTQGFTSDKIVEEERYPFTLFLQEWELLLGTLEENKGSYPSITQGAITEITKQLNAPALPKMEIPLSLDEQVAAGHQPNI